MKEAKFLVQGSVKEPYEVHFLLDGQNFSAFCTCLAGTNGQHCKHRLSIMAGKKKGIVSENLSEVNNVVAWLEGTDVGEIWKQMKELEASAGQKKERLASLKRELARRMRN